MSFDDFPLHLAAMNGNNGDVILLLEQGADINEKQHHDTPLSLAVKNNHYETVQLLIREGADLTEYTGLIVAIREKNYETARLLIENGASQVTPYGGYCCSRILKDRELSREQKVGIIRSITGTGRVTPLALFSIENPADFDFFVQELNMDLSTAAPGDPISVLHKAALDMKPQIAEYLLEKGVDVNSADSNGTTPIVYAIMAYGPSVDWNEPVIESEKEARVKFISDMPYYRDPQSVRKRNVQTVSVLLNASADLNIPNRFGWSAAHFAASSKPAGLMEILINNGSDLNAATNQGRSVADVAAANKNRAVMDLLK